MSKKRNPWTAWLDHLSPDQPRNQGATGSEDPKDEPMSRFVQANPKLVRNLVLLAVLGGLLMVLGSADLPSSRSVPANSTQMNANAVVTSPDQNDDVAVGLERELEVTLRQVEGVGTVDVFLTLDRGAERVYALEEEREETTRRPEKQGETVIEVQSRRTSRPVVLRNDQDKREEPLIRVEKYPVVRGVLVVAEGAADPGVRLRITESVATLLGIPAHRIAVQAKRR